MCLRAEGPRAKIFFKIDTAMTILDVKISFFRVITMNTFSENLASNAKVKNNFPLKINT